MEKFTKGKYTGKYLNTLGISLLIQNIIKTAISRFNKRTGKNIPRPQGDTLRKQLKKVRLSNEIVQGQVPANTLLQNLIGDYDWDEEILDEVQTVINRAQSAVVQGIDIRNVVLPQNVSTEPIPVEPPVSTTSDIPIPTETVSRELQGPVPQIAYENIVVPGRNIEDIPVDELLIPENARRQIRDAEQRLMEYARNQQQINPQLAIQIERANIEARRQARLKIQKLEEKNKGLTDEELDAIWKKESEKLFNLYADYINSIENIVRRTTPRVQPEIAQTIIPGRPQIPSRPAPQRLKRVQPPRVEMPTTASEVISEIEKIFEETPQPIVRRQTRKVIKKPKMPSRPPPPRPTADVEPDVATPPTGDIQEDIIQQVEQGRPSGREEGEGLGLGPTTTYTISDEEYSSLLSNSDIIPNLDNMENEELSNNLRTFMRAGESIVSEYESLSTEEEEEIIEGIPLEEKETFVKKKQSSKIKKIKESLDKLTPIEADFRRQIEWWKKMITQPKKLFTYLLTWGMKNPSKFIGGLISLGVGSGVVKKIYDYLTRDKLSYNLKVQEEQIQIPDQVIQQDEQGKGTLRPKFIIPTDKIFELTGNEVNTDLLEFSAFDYVVPTSEGTLGNVQTNPLKREAMTQERILMEGGGIHVDSVFGAELPYTQKQLMDLFLGEPLPRMEFKPISEYEVGDNQVEPFDWNGDRTAIEAISPYKNFTDVHQMNIGFESSQLYGYQP